MPAIVQTTSTSVTNHSPLNLEIMRDPRNITFSGKVILMFLANFLPDIYRASAAHLSDRCSISHPTTIHSLQRLVKLGLVDRHADQDEIHVNKARISYYLSQSYADHLMTLMKQEAEVTAA